MPKVHVSKIVQDLTDLSVSANCVMQQNLTIQRDLESDWFALVKDVVIKIAGAKDIKELNSVDKSVPGILSFLKPESEKKRDSNSLQEEVSRAHIHTLKQNAIVVLEKLPTDTEQLENSKSTVDVNKLKGIHEESCCQENGPTAGKMISIVNDTEANKENSINNSKRTGLSSKKAEAEHIATKVLTAEYSKGVRRDPSKMTPEKKKSPITDAVDFQSENNYHQTPKALKEPPKSCCLTQIIDKKCREVCNNVSESAEKNDKGNLLDNNGKRSRREGVALKRKEAPECNVAAKGKKVLKEDGIGAKVLLSSQKSALNVNTTSQKNIPSVIPPTYMRNIALKNSAQAIAKRKEEERLRELKLKEEKANEKLQKVEQERQMKIQQNKRKRQERMEQVELKRQKLEKEKELKMNAKIEAAPPPMKPNKNPEERSNDLAEKHPKVTPAPVNETVVLSKSTPPSAPLKSKVDENIMKTPVNTVSKDEITSYEMTPVQENSDDSDDDSKRDRSKKIPAWAQGISLKSALVNQHYSGRNAEEIFGSIIESPDLEKIFCKKRQHYNKRTSSRIWEKTIIVEDEED